MSELQANKYYHIFNRGNNKENLFCEDKNYSYFLRLWGKYIHPVADTLAYCLLPNHFHFLVRIREITETTDELVTETCQVFENLAGLDPQSTDPSKAFSNLFNAYTKAYNLAYDRTGSLFQKPFKRKEISTEDYFIQLVHYIHLNPQKHGLVDDFRNWPFSSYESIMSEKATKLDRGTVRNWFGGTEHYISFHKREIIGRPLVFEDFE
jgi:putative transposase